MLTTTEQLQEKFQTPQTFRFEGERNTDYFFYTVDAELFGDLRAAYDIYPTPMYLNPLFHPQNSIDDFLFWLELMDRDEFSKTYNLEVFGCVNVEYGIKDHPDGPHASAFHITVRYPDLLMPLFGIQNMLKYLVCANYKSLARRLSVHQHHPPFRCVFLTLKSDSHEIVDGNGSIVDCFNAPILADGPHGEYIFKDFEPTTFADNVFVACQPLPFPLIDLDNPDTFDRPPESFWLAANADNMQVVAPAEIVNVIPP